MSKFADYLKPDEAEGPVNFEQMADQAMNEEAAAPVSVMQRVVIPEWLKAETGEGSVEDYLEHPMNFNHSKSTARVLRGMTGMFGSLRYAVIDVVLGIMEMGRERKARAAAVEVPTNAPAGY